MTTMATVTAAKTSNRWRRVILNLSLNMKDDNRVADHLLLRARPHQVENTVEQEIPSLDFLISTGGRRAQAKKRCVTQATVPAKVCHAAATGHLKCHMTSHHAEGLPSIALTKSFAFKKERAVSNGETKSHV